MEHYGGRGEAPRTVYLRNDESEIESNRGGGEALCVVFSCSRLRGSLLESGSSGFTLSGGVWCCSGTTTKDPAWRWPSRCGAPFGSLSTRSHACRFGDYMSVRPLEGALLRVE